MANPHSGALYPVRFAAPEFAAIRPIASQPDFGTPVIDHARKDWILEAESLKLFLQSFRNHGAFNEDCTLAVAKRVIEAISPTWLLSLARATSLEPEVPDAAAVAR